MLVSGRNDHLLKNGDFSKNHLFLFVLPYDRKQRRMIFMWTIPILINLIVAIGAIKTIMNGNNEDSNDE